MRFSASTASGPMVTGSSPIDSIQASTSRAKKWKSRRAEPTKAKAEPMWSPSSLPSPTPSSSGSSVMATGRKSLPNTRLGRDTSAMMAGTSYHSPAPSSGPGSSPGPGPNTSEGLGATTPSLDPSDPFPLCPAHLAAHPLPVRLGVIPDPILGGPVEDHTPRFSDGYYFCIPPPTQRERLRPVTSKGHFGSVRRTQVPPPISPTASSFTTRRRTSFSSVSLQTLSLTKTNSGSSANRVIGDSAASSSQSLLSSATANLHHTPAPSSSLSFWSRGATRSSANTSEASAPPTPSLSHSIATDSHCSESDSAFGSYASTPHHGAAWHPSQYFITTTSLCGGKSIVRKSHPYPSEEVPYWFGYDADTLNAEMWLFQYSSKQSGLDTFVPMKTPPKRVLDLGSGLGMWCLDMAKKWETTEFIGLDVVPIQTPVSSRGDPDISSRVSWVVANFLQTFPFPDASFDFVRCRGNSPAVPEDAWSSLFSEITRVLTPGGYVEIIDANYTFFGMPRSILLADAIAVANGKSVGDTEALFGKNVRAVGREDAQTRRTRKAYEALKTVYERMFARRFINPTPLSILPAQLLMQGLSNVGLATPRHIPLPARPWRETVGTSNETGTAGGDTVSDLGKGMKTAIELRKFVFANQDEARSVSIVQLVWYLKGARDIVWAEAEAEKQRILRANGLATGAAGSVGQDVSVDSAEVDEDMYSHPWSCKAEFEEDLDNWAADLLRRADLGSLITDLIGWKDGSPELQQTHAKGGRDGKLPAHYAKALPASPTVVLPGAERPDSTPRGHQADLADPSAELQHTVPQAHQARTSPLSDVLAQSNINTSSATTTTAPQRPPLPARTSSYHREADAKAAAARAKAEASSTDMASAHPTYLGEKIEILGFRDVSVFIACNP